MKNRHHDTVLFSKVISYLVAQEKIQHPQVAKCMSGLCALRGLSGYFIVGYKVSLFLTVGKTYIHSLCWQPES
jgi:hypothetical protein